MAKIIFVSSNEPISNLLKEYFDKIGIAHEIIYAYNYEEVLNLIKFDNINLLIVDSDVKVIERREGYEAARLLKENPLTKSVPLLFVGLTNEIKVKKAVEAGCDNYIQFPVSPLVLFQEIEAMLTNISPKD